MRIFLVEFAPEAKRGLDSYFAFKADLEALLQRGVDLVEPASLRTHICWRASIAPANWCMQRDPRAWLWDVREAAQAIEAL
jgi:hypothetical protein